ncbi:MAG: hypothetical protein U1F52_08430 [Burkholderiales bacterium]
MFRALLRVLRSTPWLPLLPVAALLLPAWSASADEATMTYVEFRMTAPWIKPDSFNGATRKLWRHEDARLRMEEPRNPGNGVEMTMIANLPDAWMLDRVKKVGRHFVDPGPRFNVIFPVFQVGAPVELKGLQMGREVAFVKDQADVERAEATLDGAACETYAFKAGGADVRLWVDKATGHPRQASLKTEKIAYSVRYEVYRTGLPFDAALFSLPPDVEVDEAK